LTDQKAAATCRVIIGRIAMQFFIAAPRARDSRVGILPHSKRICALAVAIF
jgi:hypothetical protein